MFYIFSAFGFTNSQTYCLSNINELSIKKGTVKQHYKESRADRSSRQKNLPPYSNLLTSTRNIPPQK